MQTSLHQRSLGISDKEENKNAPAVGIVGMKRITQLIVSRQLTTLLLAISLAGTTTAGTMVPIHGSLDGSEFHSPSTTLPPPGFRVDGNATGIASHLGKVAITWGGDVDPTFPGGPHADNLRREFVAANGDSLVFKGFADGTFPVPIPGTTLGVIDVTEQLSVVSGTGRFFEAEGDITVNRSIQIDFTNPADENPVFDGTFSGFISTVGSTNPAHAVPEPASMALALVCLLGLVTCLRRRSMVR